MDTENRFVDIEIKLARQEDLVETLNRTIYRQQKKLDALEALCAALARKTQDMASDGGELNAGDEKPPHY